MFVFTLAISVLSIVLKLCRKERKKVQVKKESQQKSKPMMNLLSRCSVRAPGVLASTASESLEKTRYESQLLLSSWTEQQPRTVRRVMGASSSDFSEWNIDDKWSSQGRTSGEMLEARTVRPILAEQSNQLVEPASLLMKTPTPSTEDPAQEDLLQKYKERAERLSQQNRVINICTDAGFLTTVEVGQYFMTKDTDEFSQFTEPVACRECPLSRDEKII